MIYDLDNNQTLFSKHKKLKLVFDTMFEFAIIKSQQNRKLPSFQATQSRYIRLSFEYWAEVKSRRYLVNLFRWVSLAFFVL